MNIVSWSPVHGKPGTTSNLLAITLFSTEFYKMSNIITQTNFTMNNLEVPLVGSVSNILSDSYFIQDIGIDILARRIKSAPLDKDAFYNASLSLLNKKLALLPGTTKNNEEFYENDMEKVINNIFRSAEQFYDVLFIDTNSGKNNLSMQVIDKADIIIINLCQNKSMIDNYFKEYSFDPKKVFYLIGNYDRRSKNNLKNLRRQYKEMNSKNSAIIPYCTEFCDAFSDGNLIEFMKRNIGAGKEDKNKYFIDNVALATQKILKKAGWKGENT